MKKTRFLGSLAILLSVLMSMMTMISPTLALASAPTASVWWPVAGARLSGSQPFKALLDGASLGSYQMFWQVDGGQLNQMADNYADYPHKEAQVDMSGWHWQPSGAYTLKFVAKDWNGNELAATVVPVLINAAAAASAPVVVPTPTPAPTPAPTPTPGPAPVPTPVPVTVAAPAPTIASNSSGNPLSGAKLYVNANNPAKQQADAWRSSRPADAAAMDKIANSATARWFGDWNGGSIQNDVRNYVSAANSAGAMPTLVLYDIPGRDCNSWSAGGAPSMDAYRSWISQVASGIGSAKATIILEPDALSGISCLSQDAQSARLSLLSGAVSSLKANSNAVVYLDAGNSHWVSAADMAPRLRAANIARADGFSLNVSNFFATDDSAAFGKTLSALVGNKHFVIDTSRNGNGPAAGNPWCNPDGRALGSAPTTSTGNSLIDALLWLKQPGESDGACNAGPSAGTWWPDYALGLASRAK